MVQGLFPDNTVLCNFAAVERFDLLRDWLRGRGRWTEAVEHEAGLSSGHLPALREVLDGGWLGEAIEVFDDDVEKIRRHAFGGPTAQPRKHLGEAQTCVLILNHAEFAGSWWLSDDTDAVKYAQRRGITTYRTIDMAALGVHRFLRAVEPGDTWRITLVVVATVAAAMLLAWQARSDSTGVVAAGGAALGAGLLAVVTDVISEHLAAIPASWGLMLLIVVGLFAWSRSQ